MKNSNLAQKINKTIKEKKIKMRSRFSVMAEKLGLESAAVLLILISILIIGLIGYVLIESGALEFTDFGWSGFGIVFLKFPYELLIIAIVLIIITGYILKSFDFSYKNNFSLIIVLIVFGVILFGLTTAAFNIPRKIHNLAQEKNIPFASSFFKQKIGYNLKKGPAQIGEIINLENNLITITTPLEEEIEVIYDQETLMPQDIELEIGQKIAVLGQLENGLLKAQGIKIFSGQYWHHSNENRLRPRRQGPFRLMK
ncbi:MAG: hypothetical protein U5L76_05325 [Patescibacteria group bacterium]|nr:hypothetical protein [Patescibacteria group bacterium]